MIFNDWYERLRGSETMFPGRVRVFDNIIYYLFPNSKHSSEWKGEDNPKHSTQKIKLARILGDKRSRSTRHSKPMESTQFHVWRKFWLSWLFKKRQKNQAANETKWNNQNHQTKIQRKSNYGSLEYIKD